MTPCLFCADAESIPGLQAPRTPAYNHSAVGHVPFIAEEPPLSVADEVRLDKQFNDRWRTLLSVDDLVGAVVGALESTGLAKNTCTGPATFSFMCFFPPCGLADEIALRRHLLQQRSVRDTPRQLMHRSFVPFLTRALAGSGYHLGLFRIGQGKQHHYDFDIRVPLCKIVILSRFACCPSR